MTRLANSCQANLRHSLDTAGEAGLLLPTRIRSTTSRTGGYPCIGKRKLGEREAAHEVLESARAIDTGFLAIRLDSQCPQSYSGDNQQSPRTLLERWKHERLGPLP